MRQSQRKFLVNTVLMTGSRLLLTLRGLILLPVFAKLLGAEEYGIFTQITVTVTLLAPLVSLKLEMAATRRLSAESDREAFKVGFYSPLLLVFLLAIVVGAVLLNPGWRNHLAHGLFGNPSYSGYLVAVAGLLAVTALDLFLQSYYQVTQRFKILAATLMGLALVETGLIALVVFKGYGVKGALMVAVASRFGANLVLFGFLFYKLGWFRFDRRVLWQMLIYSLPLVPNLLLHWAIDYGDRFLIAHFLGLPKVGIYAASYTLGMAIMLFYAPVSMVFFPQVSRLWDQGQRGEVQAYFTQICRYFLLFALPACTGIALLSPSILTLFSTPEFITSRLLVSLIIAGIALSGLFQINVFAFHLTGKTVLISVLLVWGAVCNLALNFILIPRLGLEGAALATAAAFASMAFFATLMGRRLIGYPFPWRPALIGVLASGIMGIIIWALPQPQTPWGLLAMVLVGAIIYSGIVWLSGTFTVEERRALRKRLPF